MAHVITTGALDSMENWRGAIGSHEVMQET